MKNHYSLLHLVFGLFLITVSSIVGCTSEEQIRLQMANAYEQGKRDGISEIWAIAQEKGYKDGYQNGLQTGRVQGYKGGFNKGLIIGEKEGFQRGHENGKMEGYSLGWENGYGKGNTEGYSTGYKEGNEMRLATKAKLAMILQALLLIAIILSSITGIVYMLTRPRRLSEYV